MSRFIIAHWCINSPTFWQSYTDLCIFQKYWKRVLLNWALFLSRFSDLIKDTKTTIHQKERKGELIQTLHDELFDKRNNSWALILERKYFVKNNGDWNQSRLSLVAKKLRVYDKRLKNKALLAWVDNFYKDTEQIVFPISIKRKEIIKVFKELKQSGQFPSSGFLGWVAQRGTSNKAQIK